MLCAPIDTGGCISITDPVPGGSDDKEYACNEGDLGSIPGLGRSPGGRYGNPLQSSRLENPHGQRSLAGYSLWGCKESDMTGWLSTAQLVGLVYASWKFPGILWQLSHLSSSALHNAAWLYQAWWSKFSEKWYFLWWFLMALFPVSLPVSV